MTNNQNRKLAAILFADIVGYTSLMQHDEQTASTLLRHFQKQLEEKVNAHQGRIVNFYGDGALCTFTIPIDAVRCAMALQTTFSDDPKTPVRIGIHSGTVTLEGEKIFGDSVNITSRIESLGKAGAILISKKVRDEVKNNPDLKLQSLGSFEFKNVEEPMEVFALANEGFAIPKREEMKGKLNEYSLTKTIKKNWLAILSILFFTILAGAFIFPKLTQKDSSSTNTSSNTLSIISFENLTNGIENELFCKGITEDIKSHLAKLKSLKIVNLVESTENEKAIETAIQLDVNYLLQGSVRRIEDDVRVVAKLTNTESKEQIWAETYDRKLTGIFEIQSDIASKIAKALKIKLSDNEKASISPFGTDNMEAYKLYLKAIHNPDNSIEARNKKLEDLKRVIQMDSTFAAAHASLGETYAFLATWWHNHQYTTDEIYQKAKREFEIAQKLNPYEESVYRRMATLNIHFEWDFEAAEINIQKSLDLNPSSIGPLDYAQWLYTLQGKFKKSISFGEKVLAINPDYPWGNSHHGLTLFVNGQEKESVEVLTNLVEKHPKYASGIWRLAQVYLAQDSVQKTTEVIENGLKETNERYVPFITMLGASNARQGNWTKANEYIEELQKRKREGEPGLNFYIAMIYAGGKDETKTISWLEKSYEAHDVEIVWIKVYPVFQFIHQNPTYLELVKKINLD